MRPRLAGLAAFLAAFALAPAAHAFTVNSEGDGADADPGDGTCETATPGECTLRAAIEQANAQDGLDPIDFAATVDEIDVATTLQVGCAGSCPVGITGPVTLSWTGSVGPLLRFAAGAEGSSVEELDVAGGTSSGIEVSTGGVGITRTRVFGSAGRGIDLGGNEATISASPIFGNAGLPIAGSPLTAPKQLRVGPRRADGALPLTGSTGGGILELFRGDPTASSPISFLRGFDVPGGTFTHLPSPEPAPGSVLAATVRSGGTSGFATVRVPFDVVSPDLVGAVATSTSEVLVQLSEPVQAGSVQPEDFSLTMAGAPRPLAGAAVLAGGAQVMLTSSAPWGHGEAGDLRLAGAGTVLDAGGNANLAATAVRVAAAPGDFIGPVGSSLSISPSTLCLTQTRSCRRTGTTIRFVASEAGRAHLVLMRGNRRIGVDEALSEVGRNRIRFNGRLGNRKLRAGSYRMLLYLEDAVGNMTVEPPIQLFKIRRSTSRR